MNFRVNINICRVCMNSHDGTSLMEDKELSEKFVFTTRLKLNANDDMPSLICGKCSKRLRVAYDFVKLAHDTENNLKAFLIKISQDFQLVTKSTSDKNKSNEDEDEELLSTVLEDECAEKEAEELGHVVSVQTEKDTGSSSKLLNKRKTTATEKQENKGRIESNNQNCVIIDTPGYSTEDIDSSYVEENAKKEIAQGKDKLSKSGLKRDADITELISVQPTSNDEIKNEASPQHEIQILDYTDEESQTELEILEENLQPSDDSRSSLGEVDQQSRRSDGFFKEYQAMIEDGDEYLEDNNSMQSKAEGTPNDIPLFDGSEEVLEDTDLEMKTIVEANSEEEHVGNTTQSVTHSIETVGLEPKAKIRKTQNKIIGRNVRVKKVDELAPSKRFFCFKCNRDFSTKTNLTRHMTTHEGNRPFQCDVCYKSFSQNVSLKQHMYTHTGEKPYQCEVCHRGFTQCKSLVFHMRRHTGEKPFPCEKCGALFRQKDGLKTHILKRHTIKSQHGSMELITCAICKEVLADNNSLQEHMKKHLNDYVRVDSAMSCTSREGNTGDMLLEYIDDDPLHDKTTVFIDDSVQENATDIVSSSAHVVDLMTTSALEPSRAKKYQCRICFKCFAIKKSLIRHLTTHNIAIASKEFACKLCELCFSSSEELRTHNLREHNSSGEPFQCELCQSMFSSSEELQKHNKLPHAFKCNECPNMQFISRRLLTEHTVNHELNEIQ